MTHYSAQLVDAGWKSEGQRAIADGLGVQRFSFREGQEAWTGVLLVMALGERREILLRLSKNE